MTVCAKISLAKRNFCKIFSNTKKKFISKDLTNNQRLALKAPRIAYGADRHTQKLGEAGGDAVGIKVVHVGNVRYQSYQSSRMQW